MDNIMSLNINNWREGSVLHQMLSEGIARSPLFEDVEDDTPVNIMPIITENKKVKANKINGITYNKNGKPRKMREAKKEAKGSWKSSSNKNFWKVYGASALAVALQEDKKEHRGNYKLVKEFLQKDYINKKYIKRADLQFRLDEKFGSPFRMQLHSWANGEFYGNDNSVALKPILKAMSRGIYLNIFHKTANNTTDYKNTAI
jgi:hypothetical protein